MQKDRKLTPFPRNRKYTPKRLFIMVDSDIFRLVCHSIAWECHSDHPSPVLILGIDIPMSKKFHGAVLRLDRPIIITDSVYDVKVIYDAEHFSQSESE